MMGHTDGVSSVSFSPDGRQVVSGGMIRALWDASRVKRWSADGGAYE